MGMAPTNPDFRIKKGEDNTGNPTFLSAWSKKEVQWVTPEEITYDGIYVLKPAATSTQAYEISVNSFGFSPFSCLGGSH